MSKGWLGTTIHDSIAIKQLNSKPINKSSWLTPWFLHQIPTSRKFKMNNIYRYLNDIAVIAIVFYSATISAATSGVPIPNEQCDHYMIGCSFASDKLVKDRGTNTVCCSRSLGYCIVAPNDPKKDCTYTVIKKTSNQQPLQIQKLPDSNQTNSNTTPQNSLFKKQD